MHSIEDIVKQNLCISCGICAAVAGDAINFKEDQKKGMYLPFINNSISAEMQEILFNICPGKGYPIEKMASSLFNETPNYNISLGHWTGMWAARSTDNKLLEKAASGGIMTAVVEYLIEIKEIDGALVTGIKYGKPGPRPASFVAKKRSDLLVSQGSKYAPSPTLLNLIKLATGNRIAAIGTPCQLAAIRILQNNEPKYKSIIPWCVGNFCGGFRDLRETDTLIRRSGLEPDKLVDFYYRGGVQPGHMYMKDIEHRQRTLKYPEYAKRTGFIKHKRCRLCVDACAELADIACGDAWIPRFLKTGKSWSIILTRSERAEKIIQEMFSKGKIELKEISIDELMKSQEGNILSKKYRQMSRRRLYKIFGVKMPKFGGGYIKSNTGLLFEFRVYLSTMLFSLLERFKLYFIVNKLIGRIT